MKNLTDLRENEAIIKRMEQRVWPVIVFELLFCLIAVTYANIILYSNPEY